MLRNQTISYTSFGHSGSNDGKSRGQNSDTRQSTPQRSKADCWHRLFPPIIRTPKPFVPSLPFCPENFFVIFQKFIFALISCYYMQPFKRGLSWTGSIANFREDSNEVWVTAAGSISAATAVSQCHLGLQSYAMCDISHFPGECQAVSQGCHWTSKANSNVPKFLAFLYVQTTKNATPHRQEVWLPD